MLKRTDKRHKPKRHKPLPCGCEPTGELVVRTYANGEKVWGYACKCGKVFKKRGSL